MSAVEIVPFTAEQTEITDLWVLGAKQVTDERGTVREFYRESAFVEAGVPSMGPFLQMNLTSTAQGAVRGLHGEAMTKLVGVAAGAAFGAYVDTRPGSATFGRVVTVDLTPGVQVLVPAGVCNGFQCTAPGVTQYFYAFTAEWVPGMAGTALTPLDADLGISWPIPLDAEDRAQVSAKDAAAPTLSELPRD